MSLPNNTTALTALLSAVEALPDKIDTSGTAVAADIYAGKTATVNDVKLTGSNPYNSTIVDPAVTSALAALAEKGVDTSGKWLADIAGLIASIEAGGGASGYLIDYGSFTLTEDAQYHEVSHNLGKTPVLIVAASTSLIETKGYYVLGVGTNINGWHSYSGYKNFFNKAVVQDGLHLSAHKINIGYSTGSYPIDANVSTGTSSASDAFSLANDSTFRIGRNGQTGALLKAGMNYRWWAIG